MPHVPNWQEDPLFNGYPQKEKWVDIKDKGSAWSSPTRYDVLFQSECFKNSDTTLVLNGILSFVHMVYFPIATFTRSVIHEFFNHLECSYVLRQSKLRRLVVFYSPFSLPAPENRSKLHSAFWAEHNGETNLNWLAGSLNHQQYLHQNRKMIKTKWFCRDHCFLGNLERMIQFSFVISSKTPTIQRPYVSQEQLMYFPFKKQKIHHNWASYFGRFCYAFRLVKFTPPPFCCTRFAPA